MRNLRALVLAFGLLPLLAPLSLGQAPDPEDLEFKDGVASIPDRETYERLSHQGDAGRDSYLNGIQFVKFQLEGAGGDDPKLYFINTRTRQSHPSFMRDLGIGGGFGGGRGRGGRGRGEAEEIPPGQGRQMRGAIAYRPLVRAPDGSPGTYTFDFQPRDSFSVELLEICYDIIIEKAPFLYGKFVYHPLSGGLDRYHREKAEYEQAEIPVYLDEALDMNLAFLPMNPGKTFGRLRRMSLEELPTPRDVVLYESLPNELPRVAGMITGVRQTPLSHVNLRAIQDRVPNAFIADAAKDPKIQALVGKLVHYRVSPSGYQIREASREEVDAHFAALRPTAPQSPPRDLSVTEIRPLEEIEFGHSDSFGVKTTNLATMHGFELPAGMLPEGFGVPFHFYDAFMKHNDLYQKVESMLADPVFQSDAEAQQVALAELRAQVVAGTMPDWMTEALGTLQASFPEGTSIRCRSSTNNEDLPGFSGAGLYDSFTHPPDAGHLASSIKVVFASLWNFRAFEERDFYRVDHLQTAMGVLAHPNYSMELANGVAVSLDILYQTDGHNYVNSQVGEDMVTNPEALSIPEELLLPWRGGPTKLMQSSNRVGDDERVLSAAHLATLKSSLEKIHDEFARLYGKKASDPKFAMEIEFKVTSEDVLAIKQARPWIFPSSTTEEGTDG